MIDDHAQALLARLQHHNDEIAHAAAERVLGMWEAALRARGASSKVAREPEQNSVTPTTPERMADLVVDGFKRLGSVVGLSVVTGEPGLLVDEMSWLRRAFGARHMTPQGPGWDVELLEAYVDASCAALPDDDCAAIREAVDRATAALALA